MRGLKSLFAATLLAVSFSAFAQSAVNFGSARVSGVHMTHPLTQWVQLPARPTEWQVNRVTVEGPHAADFRIARDLWTARTVPAGKPSLESLVEFVPTGLGVRNARLIVATNFGEIRAPLTGIGLPRKRSVVELSPVVIELRTNEALADAPIQVRLPEQSAVHSPRITGANASSFQLQRDTISGPGPYRSKTMRFQAVEFRLPPGVFGLHRATFSVIVETPITDIEYRVPLEGLRAEISVTEVAMASRSMLSVTTERRFGGQRLPVTFQVNVGGRSYLTTVELPSSDGVGQAHLIDLAQLGVPRFQNDELVRVVAGVGHSANSRSSSEKTGLVRLPIVLMPGIDLAAALGFGGRPMAGDGTWSRLETYFTTELPVGQRYRLRGGGPYPTLYTVGYARNLANFTEAAVALRGVIEEAMELTHAARVNLVAHSKGAVAARAYFSLFAHDRRIRNAVLIQGPHTGSIWAAALPVTPQADLRNLLPTYPSWRPDPTQPYGVWPGNPELEALNQIPLPIDIRIDLLVSLNDDTPVSMTGAEGDMNNQAPGDGVVPLFSQLGRIGDPATGQTVDTQAFAAFLQQYGETRVHTIEQNHVQAMDSVPVFIKIQQLIGL